MTKKRLTVFAWFWVCICFLAANAEFCPERIYKQKAKVKLNYGWKFKYDDVSDPIIGDPSQKEYKDDDWETVNIPHSATYDTPTVTSEKNGFIGTCWYRKAFVVPSKVSHTGRLFLIFDGAMQASDVYLNGTKIGANHVSGYTWFGFDVTNDITAGNNSLVVKLNNEYSADIPPGDMGNTSTGPDYMLYSGLYRNVWLLCTDKCYIPLYGQQISVPAGPYTSGADVITKTTVKNFYDAAKTVTLRYVIAYGDIDQGFLVDSMTQALDAGASAVFNKTISTITNPHLWSLSDPYLYRLYTQVYADGVLVDDYVDRFGVRWYTWTVGDKFKLNGESVFLQGTSAHQFYPWIQNAMSPSRFYRDIKMNKDMGVNLVRCAHYPRDPSYYDVCDELGMLLMVEIPTWGNGTTSYSDIFWNRCDTAMHRMIEAGYNHPSIVSWGLFNEPAADFTDSVKKLGHLNILAHMLDSTRITYIANNRTELNNTLISDIAGLNYITRYWVSAPNPLRTLSTEYHIGWDNDYAYRGDSRDLTDTIAANFWSSWTEIVNASATNALAGGCMWCFADYWSMMNTKPMGVVDVYRIPKTTYYLYKKKWTGVSGDNPVKGLVPTKVDLVADTSEIIADSTDVALVYASIRSAGDTCVHTGYESSCKTYVSFSVSGPTDFFGSSRVRADGGKCALLLKSTNTPGSIMVIASSPGLISDTVYINSVAPDTSALPFISPVIYGTALRTMTKKISVTQAKGAIRIEFPSQVYITDRVSLINLQGKIVAIKPSIRGTTLTINTKHLAAGFYCLNIDGINGNVGTLRKIFIAK
jgi:hypothetical protein